MYSTQHIVVLKLGVYYFVGGTDCKNVNADTSVINFSIAPHLDIFVGFLELSDDRQLETCR